MRPENSIPALECAVGVAVEALGLDLAATKDNVLMISHEPILWPAVCSGDAPTAVIHRLTLAQVREWDCGKMRDPQFATQQTVPGAKLPTLDEVFRLAPRGKFTDTGLTVIPWTANEPVDWDKLIAAQVDGIIPDNPAALIAI